MDDLLAEEALSIDCSTCVMRCTSQCDDCIVTFVCDRERSGAMVLDLAEARALRTFQMAGMLPGVRHQLR